MERMILVETDKGPWWVGIRQDGDEEFHFTRKLGGRVTVRVPVWDVGEPVSLLMASAPDSPKHQWFNVGQPLGLRRELVDMRRDEHLGMVPVFVVRDCPVDFDVGNPRFVVPIGDDDAYRLAP